jgi:hypothetical protein
VATHPFLTLLSGTIAPGFIKLAATAGTDDRFHKALVWLLGCAVYAGVIFLREPADSRLAADVESAMREFVNASEVTMPRGAAKRARRTSIIKERDVKPRAAPTRKSEEPDDTDEARKLRRHADRQR